MNILFVNRALGTLIGGGEIFDITAARYLQKLGHKITIVTGKPLWGRPTLLLTDITVIYLPIPNLRWVYYFSGSIKGKLIKRIVGKIGGQLYRLDLWIFEKIAYKWFVKRKFFFDIVQCCGCFLFPKFLTKLQQPVISWLPGPPDYRVVKQIRQLVQCKHYALFLRGSTEEVLQKYGLKRDREYWVIEPGIELEVIDSVNFSPLAHRKNLHLNANDLLGITVGRLIPVKNHASLLNALAKAKGEGLVWHWLIAGNGALEPSLKFLARELDIADQVHFLGYCESKEIYSLLLSADLFALTSSYESFSIATLEAMACRLPVIGTRVGYLQHLISNADTGLLVSPGDITGMVRALHHMADQQLREKYGRNGRAFTEQFDWPLMAKKLERLYQQTIKGYSGRKL